MAALVGTATDPINPQAASEMETYSDYIPTDSIKRDFSQRGQLKIF